MKKKQQEQVDYFLGYRGSSYPFGTSPSEILKSKLTMATIKNLSLLELKALRDYLVLSFDCLNDVHNKFLDEPDLETGIHNAGIIENAKKILAIWDKIELVDVELAAKTRELLGIEPGILPFEEANEAPEFIKSIANMPVNTKIKKG